MTSSDRSPLQIYLDRHQTSLLAGMALTGLHFLLGTYYGTVHSGEVTWYFWILPPAAAMVLYYCFVEWRRKRFRDRVGPISP